MATFGDVTIKVNYEMTEVSKQLIRGLVAQVLKEALLDDSARVPFDSKDAVREFIRVEVRQALDEERIELGRAMRMHTGVSHG
jgi:hypothetical protein